MAANLLAVPALLGLGVVELSVEPAAVPEVKAAIARVDLAEAKTVMQRALALGTADEVEALMHDVYAARFGDLLAAGEVGDVGAALSARGTAVHTS
jgi:phosphoenolpyruvate-protein kinase (PTS system EI component)